MPSDRLCCCIDLLNPPFVLAPVSPVSPAYDVEGSMTVSVADLLRDASSPNNEYLFNDVHGHAATVPTDQQEKGRKEKTKCLLAPVSPVSPVYDVKAVRQ